jgi:hypothetical protein
MFYAKIEDNKAVKYPYTISDLKADCPNTSFPSIIPEYMLREFGVVNVVDQNVSRNTLKNYSYGDIENIDGVWTRLVIESDASAEEIQERIDSKWESIRDRRNSLLLRSDWTQLPDVSLTAEKQREWADYRQELRDITDATNPFLIEFPEEPE